MVCLTIYKAQYGSLVPIALWISVTSYAIKDIQIRNLVIYLANVKLKELFVSHQKAASELHQEEMRHLIANVAHDLKTVRR